MVQGCRECRATGVSVESEDPFYGGKTAMMYDLKTQRWFKRQEAKLEACRSKIPFEFGDIIVEWKRFAIHSSVEVSTWNKMRETRLYCCDDENEEGTCDRFPEVTEDEVQKKRKRYRFRNFWECNVMNHYSLYSYAWCAFTASRGIWFQFLPTYCSSCR